jgi:type III restriction enzyme
MKLELKEYQVGAHEKLLDEIDNAMSRHRKKADKIFAISLASPTGSGKTIIMTSVVETILYGNEDFDPVPDATILWVSDSPDLNEQTKRKMSMHSSYIKESQLVSVTNTLDQRSLDKGKVYFSNTQQLGKGATTFHQISDKRKYPIWDTIANTVKEQKEKFIIIIDEAHRGVNAKGKTSGGTIVQKLMDGVAGNLPVPIVVGISATPERFITSMTQDANRTLEQVQVPTLEVKKSGLIKDKLLVLHPNVVTEDDMTLLEAAVEKIKQVEASWKKYSEEQKVPNVVPLLVIQVPPKCTDQFYSSIISKIKEKWPEINDDFIRHCTQSHATITINDTTRIKYIAPPDIQDNTSIRVVLFKQALNTGWDCPRAEVMISFAVAKDPTYVAQTIGRMVRTPLARRIGTDDSLNNVALYLPNFDADSVSSVVNGLNTGDDSVTSDVIIGGLTIPRNQDISDEVFAIIESLPSYSRASKYHKNEVNRMKKMATLLVAEIDKTANKQARALVVSTMNDCSNQMDDLASREEDIRNLDVSLIEYDLVGDSEAVEGESISVPKAIEDINRLFRNAKRVLPDDTAMVYWKALCDEEE